MAALIIRDASNGLDSITFEAAAAGQEMPSGVRAGGWDQSLVLLVRNANALNPRTVTVTGHPPITVPASGFGVLPVFQVRLFGLKAITFDNVADVSVAALLLSPAELPS